MDHTVWRFDGKRDLEWEILLKLLNQKFWCISVPNRYLFPKLWHSVKQFGLPGYLVTGVSQCWIEMYQAVEVWVHSQVLKRLTLHRIWYYLIFKKWPKVFDAKVCFQCKMLSNCKIPEKFRFQLNELLEVTGRNAWNTDFYRLYYSHTYSLQTQVSCNVLLKIQIGSNSLCSRFSLTNLVCRWCILGIANRIP